MRHYPSTRFWNRLWALYARNQLFFSSCAGAGDEITRNQQHSFSFLLWHLSLSHDKTFETRLNTVPRRTKNASGDSKPGEGGWNGDARSCTMVHVCPRVLIATALHYTDQATTHSRRSVPISNAWAIPAGRGCWGPACCVSGSSALRTCIRLLVPAQLPRRREGEQALDKCREQKKSWSSTSRGGWGRPVSPPCCALGGLYLWCSPASMRIRVHEVAGADCAWEATLKNLADSRLEAWFASG